MGAGKTDVDSSRMCLSGNFFLYCVGIVYAHTYATAKPRLPPPNARMDMVSAQIDRGFLVYDIQLVDPHVASTHRGRALIHREKPRPSGHGTGTDD
ncbi:hypothetical protein COCVIDRAFT_39236 [Bipolaris victoriae FI3]|uniref:Uncharacterized protein n=1 Tax=Bipolaris victoriae (strain FI3) TaxID=930091 RepID=W7EEC7_BIPV3|nr:hypothetical protein COCVIDRAFT_39236 [Bipolaris victoriae FI3]